MHFRNLGELRKVLQIVPGDCLEPVERIRSHKLHVSRKVRFETRLSDDVVQFGQNNRMENEFGAALFGLFERLPRRLRELRRPNSYQKRACVSGK